MAQTVPTLPPPVSDELMIEIGRLCCAWSFLEYEVERTIWGLLRIGIDVGQHITYKLDMRGRWELLAQIATEHLNPSYRNTLGKIKEKMGQLTADRNLYIHGLVVAKGPEFNIMSIVYRGKGAGKPVPIFAEKIAATRTAVQDAARKLAAFNDHKNYVHKLLMPGGTP